MGLQALYELIESRQPRIIAVDGDLGAGKTTISNSLSMHYGYKCIHLDDYLQCGQGKYVELLDLDSIRKVIKDEKNPLIIDGVCLIQFLNLIGVTPCIHVFLDTFEDKSRFRKSNIVSEVEQYISNFQAPNIAHLRFSIMSNTQTNQFDVDIAYIKAKAFVSSILALGGIISILVGAFVLTNGDEYENSTIINILGAQVTAQGIGAVILSSSVLWAYFSYLSKPNYNRHRESRSNVAVDGRQESYLLETVTAETLIKKKYK